MCSEVGRHLRGGCLHTEKDQSLQSKCAQRLCFSGRHLRISPQYLPTWCNGADCFHAHVPQCRLVKGFWDHAGLMNWKKRRRLVWFWSDVSDELVENLELGLKLLPGRALPHSPDGWQWLLWVPVTGSRALFCMQFWKAFGSVLGPLLLLCSTEWEEWPTLLPRDLWGLKGWWHGGTISSFHSADV